MKKKEEKIILPDQSTVKLKRIQEVGNVMLHDEDGSKKIGFTITFTDGSLKNVYSIIGENNHQSLRELIKIQQKISSGIGRN